MSSDASLGVTHSAKTKSKHLTHKQYRSELKTALDAFQKTREWADLIQNLSKLHKVFIKFKHIHDDYNAAVGASPSVDAYRHRVLPHTVQTCKVLAMCLTPGRPAGVHLKAIEVYQAVFQNLSRQNLVADLGLWLCGLLPLASFASTRVRPILLKLLKEHIISLGEQCRVALDGLITSLLPCCEEQNTPLYFQAVELLNELAQNTGLPFFFSAIMRTICSCSHVRISATHYLNLLFKDKSQRHECIELCKANETLTIQAFLCVVRDSENVLAKRNILDLLNSYFQLNETLQNKLEPHQILLLVHGLLPVMLFREVSVNRRIYSWLLNIHTNDIDEDPEQRTINNNNDISLSMSSAHDSDDIAISEDIDNSNNMNPAINDEHVQIPLCLSEFSENMVVDAFRLYLDRTGDIHAIALNCIAPLTAYSPRSEPHNNNNNNSATNHSARSLQSFSAHSEANNSHTQRTAPVLGLSIFKKLIFCENNDNHLNAEQYITAPLNLLKILIDRNEIRSSKLIQRLHSKILQYAYSFEPNSIADPTNLESITCFQAVIQATQLIYAQIDTHRTIEWLRTMIQTKYTEFVQITATNDTVADDKSDNNDDIAINDAFLHEISPTKRKLKSQLSIEIPDRDVLFTPSAHCLNRYDSCNFTLMKAIELIDFTLDFIPIVSHRDEILDSIAHLEHLEHRERKYSSVDKNVACLVGDVLSKLHTLLIGDTRIQGIRFCLKLFQRLGKKAKTIPSEDILVYLTQSVAIIPSLQMVQEEDANMSSKYILSPRAEIHNRLELEVIELNFQLLQIVIQAQDIKTFEDNEVKHDDDDDDDNMRRKIAHVILQHLEFAEKCVYRCKSEQMVICGAQIWLKLINSFPFVAKHQGSCKKITQRLWELIEASKSSAINYQIAKLLLTLADINYAAVERVLSQNIIAAQHRLQHNLTVLAEGYQRFCTLYRIIGELKPLKFYWNELVYIMLAACDDDRPLIHNISTQWLTESLAIPPRVLDPMIIELLETSTQTNPIGPEIYQYHQWYDARLACDTLKKLLNIVISMGAKLISACKNCILTTNVVDKLLLHGCSLNADHLQNHLQAMLDSNNNNSYNATIAKKKYIELRVHRTSSLYLPEFECRDYLDVLVLIGLKYIRGNVDPNSTADIKNSGLRVRTIAIEFLRRLFQQFGHNLRSAKLAAGITSTIVQQLSIAIQQKQYLLQIELLSLLSTLISVTYRRVNPKEESRSAHKTEDKSLNHKTKTEDTDSSQMMLFIAEPDIFCSPFFTATIISGITQSCKLRLADMHIQLYPLKHFLHFCTFSCDYIKKGLSHFISSLFNVLCEEIANNNNIQHMKHLLDGASLLLRKLIRNPHENSALQVNDDTEFNAGTWMVHILTFGLVTAASQRKSTKTKGEEEDTSVEKRPSFLVDAEMKLFRSWPAIMHSLCVAWGRTLRATHHFFAEHSCRSHSMDIGPDTSSSYDIDGGSGRRNSLLDITEKHSISRRHRKELDEIHIRHIQEQIIDLVTPFFIRHNTLVFVAVLNNWEKELNTGKVWALEMQSTALESTVSLIDDGSLIVNYGGHKVLSRECESHKNVLNLLNRIMDDIPATVVLHSICDIAMANIHKSEIRGTSMLVRMNQCTPLHFMYYYIHSCASAECIVAVWHSLRKYFDLICNHHSCHPMAYLWTLSILQRIIEQSGSVLMSDKQRKKSFYSITKVICLKIADVAGHPEKYENNNNNNIDPMCLSPILFYVPSREHHSNDFPPLNDWIQQLLKSSEIKQEAVPPLSSNSFRSFRGCLHDEMHENLSQKVYNSHIPRVYSSPTLSVSLASIRVLANMLSLFLHQVFIKDWQSMNVDETAACAVKDNNNKNKNNSNNVQKDDVSNDNNFDIDSIASILYGVISNLSNILTLSTTNTDVYDLLCRNLAFLNAYGSILSSLSVQQYRSHTFKTYIRDAWNYFLDDKFFMFADISTLHHWQWIVGAVIECDKSKLKYELLNNPTSTINVLFNKHMVEIENRRKQLKRLAFVIHAGRRDQYGRYLNTILEKLVESLKIPNATQLYCQVFVCLRVLLTRIDVTNLSPIWPLIIAETIRFFEISSDAQLLLTVCKFVDTALILLPQTFQLFKWSFIQDSNTQKLLRRQSSSSASSTAAVNANAADTIFIPHLQLLAKRLQQERKEKKEKQSEVNYKSGMFGNGLNYNKTLKRPILLMRTIKNVYELIPFHRIVSSLHQQQSQTIDVDYKFLDDLIRSDFIQSNYFHNPLLQDIREPSPF